MKPPTQRYSQLEKRNGKDKKEFMRSLALLLFALTGSAFARTIVVPTQPVSPYADTEVSTNIVMHTSRTDTREVSIHIQLAGTPTNELEIAFGRDVNTNGVLEAQETETVYGWRGSRSKRPVWRYRHPVEEQRGTCAEAFSGHLRGRDGLRRIGDSPSAELALPRGMGHGQSNT